MPLGGLLPYPNQMPAGGGPVPPPTMGQPPEPPTADKYIQMLAMLYADPQEMKAFLGGAGFVELMKKMDLGKRQRLGADMTPGSPSTMTPQMAALKASSPTSMAAPLAPMGGGF